MTKKTERVRARVTPKQYDEIMKKVEKSDLSKSDFIRQTLLEQEVIKIDKLKDVYIELKRQGNNLNQITKAINEGEIQKPPEFDSLKSQYQELMDQLREVIKEVK